MPRFILRQYLIYPAHRRAHIFLIERSTDSETGKFQSGNFPRASFAQCFVPSSLHNSKQRLIFRRFLFLQGCAVAFKTPFSPTARPFKTGLMFVVRGVRVFKMVEGEDNIRADGVLDLNGFFRSKKMLATVNKRAKLYAVFADFDKIF